MQIHIYTKVIEEMQSKWKFASSIRCHDGCSIFNSLYLFFRVVYIPLMQVDFRNLKFLKNA